MTNEEIVQKIQAGDTTLLSDLWTQNLDQITKFAWLYTKGKYPHEIDLEGRKQPNSDIMQEMYLALMKSADSYDPDRGRTFISYYFLMARWHLISYFKNQSLIRNHDDAVLSLDYDYSSNSDDNMYEYMESAGMDEDDLVNGIFESELEKLWGIIPEYLTERENQVLVLKYYENKRPDQISRQTDLCRQRLYSLEQSALSKLRRCKPLKEIAGISDPQVKGYYNGGFARWKDTDTSSTERMAIQRYNGHRYT